MKTEVSGKNNQVAKEILSKMIVIIIGLTGFLIFLGSVGEMEPKISTNYGGLILGIVLMWLAFFLGKKINSTFPRTNDNEA